MTSFEFEPRHRWPFVGTASVVDVLERDRIDGVILAGALGRGSFIGPAVTVDVVSARTIRGTPSDVNGTEPSTLWRTLDTASVGSVLVIGTGALPLTVVGGVTAATALGRGFAGIVTDGGIRDTDEIREYGIPIRHGSSDPRAMRDQVVVGSCSQPVRFGEIVVAPGDIVVGDSDGVVCVPQDLAQKVIQSALILEGRERLWATTSRVMGSIADGFDIVSKVHGSPH